MSYIIIFIDKKMNKVFLFLTIVLILSVWVFMYTQIVYTTISRRDILGNACLAHALVAFIQLVYLEVTHSKVFSVKAGIAALAILIISSFGGLIILSLMYCCK